jgi:hypothetical protein
MNQDEPPDFLDHGTFSWDEQGYFYPGRPPVDLLHPDALASKDPWIVLAAALEHAKLGDRSHVRGVARLVSPEASPMLVRGCTSLVADAGDAKDLEALANLMLEGTDYVRIDACWGARHAGYLWLVPYMVEAFLAVRLTRDRSSIGAMFGAVLGDTDEILAYDEMEPRTYAEHVARRVEVLEKSGLAGVPLLEGRPFSVVDLAKQIREFAATRGAATGLEETFLRRRFEASTGIDCRPFFKNESFRPLTATAIVERFLAGPDAGRFQAGARYFFGHRIPD